MRYIIAATTALALVVGIALGFVVSKGLDGSASAAPPTQAVEEQNLDGDGFIAVHEQGTADVNVVSMPSLEGRLIELTIAPDGTSTPYSPFVDVSDCSLITILARGGTINNITHASPDGTTRVEVKLSGTIHFGNVNGGPTSSLQNVQVALPFLQVGLMSVSGGTAWIWCAP